MQPVLFLIPTSLQSQWLRLSTVALHKDYNCLSQKRGNHIIKTQFTELYILISVALTSYKRFQKDILNNCLPSWYTVPWGAMIKSKCLTQTRIWNKRSVPRLYHALLLKHQSYSYRKMMSATRRFLAPFSRVHF